MVSSTFRANPPTKEMNALEEELVSALQALELQSLPDSLIKTVFDTGGTATWRPSNAEERTACEVVSYDRLKTLDRVFCKYLALFHASRRHKTPTYDEELGEIDENDDGRSPMWIFFTSDRANDVIMGDGSSREHHYTGYRALFSLLSLQINISDGYVDLSPSDKLNALLQALTASKLYLAWLQLPGGGAYGLFMPFVYRQVLDALKKWIDTAVAAEAEAPGNSQSDQPSKKKNQQRRQLRGSNQSESGDSHASLQRRLIKVGSDLLVTLDSFAENYSLSSSKESILPTIEAIIHVQIASLNTDNTSVVSAVSRLDSVLEHLLSESHGDSIRTARVVIHCYIPGLCFHESTASDAKTATKLHKLAVQVITNIQLVVQRNMKRIQDEDIPEDTVEQLSSLYLGLAQNICLYAPDRADERQKVLAFLFHTCTAPELQEHDRVRLVRFLASLSKNVKAKNRQFAVELVGRLLLDPTSWSIEDNGLPPELNTFSGIGPLLEILAERSRDKVSSVRAKAIAAISAVLSAGLRTTDPDTPSNVMSEGASVPSDIIRDSLQNLLYMPSNDIEDTDEQTPEETPLMLRLVELFRDGLQDDKTFVRKAAVQALEALIVVRPGSVHAGMRKDLIDIQGRCTDSSLLVRVQAIKSLSAVLLKVPGDQDVQRLWNLGVLPLCVDPESTVQTAALELVNRVIFDRIAHWYDLRKNESESESRRAVWGLVAHLDGVMIKCAQKAVRLLLKDSKLDVHKLIKATIYAIQTCMSQSEADGVAEPEYWGFSWIVLEELALSGHLVDAARHEKKNWSTVVQCWNKLQGAELASEFADGSKRILRVVAALAPVIDPADAKEIADSILVSLHAFSIPLRVISEAVLALHSICKSKAPSADKGREISFSWGKQVLAACEANLRACFDGQPELVVEQTSLIQKQLICVGEIALLEFSKDDEKSRELGVQLIPIDTVKPLIQLFLPPEIVSSQAADSGGDDERFATPTKSTRSTRVTIPVPVRVCAFVTLGKLCLRDQDLAKSSITMLIRELRTCANQDIRSNILLILGDLCIRYTALVDVYIPTIALSFLDKSPLIRRNALLLFSQLILQDYIKWRESLLRFFLRAVVDEDEELSNLARHVLCGPLLLKAPHVFTNKFIEMIFVFNKFTGKVKFSEPFEREGIDEIALPGSAQFATRFQLYKFLLQHMSDEQKIQISMKLCTEVLEEVSDGTLKLCENPSEISDFGTEAVLKDTFAILCSPDIKLSSARDGQENEDADVEDVANEDGDGKTAAASVASQLEAAKGKLLSKMSKKNFLENVVPVLIALKHRLESKRSPLMRYLLHYIRELFKLYGQEVRDILSADPQMAMEVEYDLRQYELQQQKHSQSENRWLSLGGAASPSKQRRASGPRTPLQELENEQMPQLLNSIESRARRRLSLPSPGTPAAGTGRQRPASSEKANGDAESTTMIFSPGKAAQQDKWQVTARSPVIASRRGPAPMSQQELEDTMQRDLVSAFDSASSPDAASPQRVGRRETKPKSTSNNSVPATTLRFDSVSDQEDEDVPRLPLKKVKKKQDKLPARKKKASKKTPVDDDDLDSDHDKTTRDPFEMKTPDVSRAKRKRK